MTSDLLRESETVELKTSLAELKEGLVSIVAILNKHGAGELWFGVAPSGKPAGLDVTDKTLRDLSQAIAAHIERKIYPQVTTQTVTGKTCIHNPGKLYGGLTIEDLHRGNVSKRRNPLIADLFRRIEMVESWGRGMTLIHQNAPAVEFRQAAGLFIASFARPSFDLNDEETTGTTENTTETTQKPLENNAETTQKPHASPIEKLLALLNKPSMKRVLRDTLLPRLISGQLRLPEAQAAFDAALA